ncbi:MAG: hypothetical protein Q9226_007993, partial [Calogaya cf. arnoldii]
IELRHYSHVLKRVRGNIAFPFISDDSTHSSTTSRTEIEGIKEEINDYLEAIGDGFFATSGIIPTAVNPGLFLKGLGKVGLPLTERDAKDIVKISREAPFGKRDQKLVDESVRKTWEMDPPQVEFRNLQWSKTLQYAVSKTVEQLGVLGGESSVRADLHKLLLYEEGSFFKTHRDTEKAPGMFATLVIMLPSEHEGGELVVRLGKEKRTLSNPESNEFSYAYLACWVLDEVLDAQYTARISSDFDTAAFYHLTWKSSRQFLDSYFHKGNINSFLRRDYATERQATFALQLRSAHVLAPIPLDMSSTAYPKLCDLRSLMKQAAKTRVDCRDVCGSKARIVYSATNLFGILRRLQQEATMARSSLNTSNSTCNDSLKALCTEITVRLKQTSEFLLAYKTLGHYKDKILGSWEFDKAFLHRHKKVVLRYVRALERRSGFSGSSGTPIDSGTKTAETVQNGGAKRRSLCNEDDVGGKRARTFGEPSEDLRHVSPPETAHVTARKGGLPFRYRDPRTNFGPDVDDDLLADFLEEEEHPSKEHSLRNRLRDTYRILSEDYEPKYEMTIFFETAQDKQDSRLVAGLIHDIENPIVVKLDDLELGQDASLRNLRKMITKTAQKMLDDLERIKGK